MIHRWVCLAPRHLAKRIVPGRYRVELRKIGGAGVFKHLGKPVTIVGGPRSQRDHFRARGFTQSGANCRKHPFGFCGIPLGGLVQQEKKKDVRPWALLKDRFRCTEPARLFLDIR